MSKFDVSDDASELNVAIDSTNFPRSNSLDQSASSENGFNLKNGNSHDKDSGADDEPESNGGFRRRSHPKPLHIAAAANGGSGSTNGNSSFELQDAASATQATPKTPRTATTPGTQSR